MRIKPIAERVVLVLLSLALSEGLLRYVIGYKPHGGPQQYAFKNTLPKADPELGWTLRPGSHKTADVGERGPIVINVLDDGSRRAAERSPEAYQSELIFLGGSFVMGTAVYDEETLPWIMQSKLSDTRVRNFGVYGHGGCQSYLRMKRLIKGESLAPNSTFVYGYIHFHKTRNRAPLSYLWRIAHASQSQNAQMPRCLLAGDDLTVVYPVEISFPLIFPGFVYSTSIGTLLADAYYSYKSSDALTSIEALNQSVIREMNQLAREGGHRFIVLLETMEPDRGESLIGFLAKENIEHIVGNTLPYIPREMVAVDNGHPGPAMNAKFADMLLEKISHLGG